TLASDITLNHDLFAINNPAAGATFTINGAGHAIDGAHSFRGLFAYGGAVTIENLAINNTIARGGSGGHGHDGGGGRAGRGGAGGVGGGWSSGRAGRARCGM